MSFTSMSTSRLGLGLGFKSCLRNGNPAAASARPFAGVAAPSRSLATTIAMNGARARPNPSFNVPRMARFLGMSAFGVGLVSAHSVFQKPLMCEEGPASRPYATSGSAPNPSSDPPPESIVNVYQLSFGTLCGLCAGVFIKKGLKFIAFLLGGGFVLLQYLSSQRLISVNWGSIGKRYDAVLDRAAGPRDKDVKYYKGSTAARLWARVTDFLTANFQERASLLAGLALGLRIG